MIKKLVFWLAGKCFRKDRPSVPTMQPYCGTIDVRRPADAMTSNRHVPEYHAIAKQGVVMILSVIVDVALKSLWVRLGVKKKR